MDDDDKTPPTPPADPPADPPPPPTPPADSDALHQAVKELQETVSGLAQRVEQLTPTPGDNTPTSKPWTHRSIG